MGKRALSPFYNMNTIVIDGYNVIYAIPVLRKKILKQGPLKAREGLIEICAQYKSARKDISRIYIVFDGKRQDEPVTTSDRGGISVIFSQGEKEADDIIIELVKESDNAKSFIVISGDNYVCNNSKACSARVMSPTAFTRELGKRIIPRDRPEKISTDIKHYRSDVTDWYREELKKQDIDIAE